MKKVLSFLTAVCLVLSSVSFAAFADEIAAETEYKNGDVVASWDFEDGEVPPTDDIFPWGVTGRGTVTSTLTNIRDGISDNRYIEMKVEADGTSSLNRWGNVSFKIPDTARDKDGTFTFQVKAKFAPNGDTTRNVPQYYMGFYPHEKNNEHSIYAFINSDASGRVQSKAGNNVKQLNTASTTPEAKSYSVQFDGATDSYRFFYPSEWNTYRFVVRKNKEGYEYADLYINGKLWKTIGTKTEGQYNNKDFDLSTDKMKYFNFMVWMASNTDSTKQCNGGTVYFDDAKFICGATEPDLTTLSNTEISNVAAKGTFETESFTFDTAEAGAKSANTQVESGRALGAFNVDKAVEVKKGGGGKTENDGYVSTTSAQTSHTGFLDSHEYLKTQATELRVGDTLEISADIKFDSVDSIFQIKTDAANVDTTFTVNNSAQQDDRLAFNFEPTCWSYGAYGKNNDTGGSVALRGSARHSFGVNLPINKWINIRIFIKSTGEEDLPELSIYADGRELVKNEKMNRWYKQASKYAFSSDNKDSSDPSQIADTDSDGNFIRIQGKDLIGGLSKLECFASKVSYDNIGFTSYLAVEKPEIKSAEIIENIEKANGAGFISARGKVYTDSKTVKEVVDTFALESDEAIKSFKVVDESGNTISSEGYEITEAAGNYVVITLKSDETVYVSLVKNDLSQNIMQTSNEKTFGDFSLTSLTASEEAAKSGKAEEDKAIKLTAASSAEGTALYTWNSADPGVIEFSFLADENTNFYFGLRANLLWIDEYQNADRAWYKLLRFENNKIYGMDNNGGTTYDGAKYNEIGSYKNGEWTKIRIDFRKQNKQAWVSINGAETVGLTNGPAATIYYLKDLKFTVPAGKSITLDDVRATKGTYAKDVAPVITDNEDGDIKVLDGKLFLDLESYDNLEDVEAFATVPENLKVSQIMLGEQKTAVVENNGIYSYYPYGVYSFSGIRTNDDGVPEKIELIGKTAEQAGNAKLFAAVYEGTKLVDVKTTDLTLEQDGLGVLCAELNNYTAPGFEEGQTLKYFVWNVTNLAPLGFLTFE